jgi:hypothetical protein
MPLPRLCGVSRTIWSTSVENSTIDARDYDYWKARFRNAVLGAAAGNGAVVVPERVSPGLIVGCVLLVFHLRRRNRLMRATD